VQRLALVERQRAGELVAAARADVGDAVQRRGARERGLARPGGERPHGGVDRRPRVVAISPGDRAEILTGGGARGPLRGAAHGVAPLAGDEHPRRSEGACGGGLGTLQLTGLSHP
jgi:hypothetical protein